LQKSWNKNLKKGVIKISDEIVIITGPAGSRIQWLQSLRLLISFSKIVPEDASYFTFSFYNPNHPATSCMKHAVGQLCSTEYCLRELEESLSDGDEFGNLSLAMVPKKTLKEYQIRITEFRMAIGNVVLCLKNDPKIKELYPLLSSLWGNIVNISVQELQLSRPWISDYRRITQPGGSVQC